MRFAIISDIHSNLEALTAALKLIDAQSVDEFVCLGDIVGYGANPNECIALIRERCSIIVRGNHDAAALDLSVADGFSENARIAAQWTAKSLSPESKNFLMKLPLTATNDDALFVHASPVDPPEWNYIFSVFDAMEAFKAFPQRICFIGHSHAPGVFSEKRKINHITKDDRFIINVGSIGQPRDGNPRLSFGIFDTVAWSYKNFRGDYDRATAAEKIMNAGLPRALAERLYDGF